MPIINYYIFRCGCVGLALPLFFNFARRAYLYKTIPRISDFRVIGYFVMLEVLVSQYNEQVRYRGLPIGRSVCS